MELKSKYIPLPHYCILASSFREKLPSSKYEYKEGNTNSQKLLNGHSRDSKCHIKKGALDGNQSTIFKHLFSLLEWDVCTIPYFGLLYAAVKKEKGMVEKIQDCVFNFFL